MKKMLLLCAFAIVAATSSAQIEEMNVSDLIPQKKITHVDKSQLFTPYDGHMATSRRATVGFALKYGDRPYQGYWKEIYNIIGKQVYSVETLPDDYYRHTQEPTNKYVYAVDQNSNTLSVEEFKTGQYYDVIDILITEDEVSAIKHLFNSCPNYTGSVISYTVDGLFGSTKKSKKYTIARTDLESELFSGDYPRKEDLNGEYSFNDRQKAIYVLQDKNTKKKYYIPIENEGLSKTICLNSFSNLFVNIGKLASIQNYIVVDGFNNIKHKFEGKAVLTLKQKLCICKKIAPIDGYIMCALTDTLESEISYMAVFDISRTKLSWFNQQDSIDILTSLADGDWIMQKADVDSINVLIQLRKEEEERLKQLADAETKKELIKKYGEKFGTSISQGKICVGMTREMCVEAYGSPCEKSKSTNSLGEYEVWSYYLFCSDNMITYGITFVHFLDGKIIEIDNE